MTYRETAVIKIYHILVDVSGQQTWHEVKSDTVFVSYNPDWKDNAVRLTPKPINDPTIRWQLRVTACNRHCEIVNVGADEVHLELEGTSSLDPTSLSTQQGRPVFYEQQVSINQKVGLTFHRRIANQQIHVELDAEATELKQEHSKARPLTWIVRLRHNGNQSNVQFHLELTSIPFLGQAYRLDPMRPRCKAGQEQTTARLEFFQTREGPVRAGDYLVTISARADEYRGELAKDFQILTVSPFYNHTLIFEEDVRRAAS